MTNTVNNSWNVNHPANIALLIYYNNGVKHQASQCIIACNGEHRKKLTMNNNEGRKDESTILLLHAKTSVGVFLSNIMHNNVCISCIHVFVSKVTGETLLGCSILI